MSFEIIDFHPLAKEEDQMDEMVQKHPNLTFVAAHPGESPAFMRHLERMNMSENYYLDLSGYGMFRHGMLRHGIDKFGAERFLFGSDYPTCNPAMYLGGVLLDGLITAEEKKKIFFFKRQAPVGPLVPLIVLRMAPAIYDSIQKRLCGFPHSLLGFMYRFPSRAGGSWR